MTEPVNKRSVLLVITLTTFCIPFMWSSVNIALPSIAADLDMDAIQLSWIISGFTLASIVSILPFGRLADIHGRKRIYTFGVIGFAVTSLGLAFSDSAFFLIFVRVLQGITGAMIFSTGAAILTSVFQPGERGRALGIFSASVYLGLSVGPFIGGVLTTQLGWRSIFGVTTILCLIAMVFIYTRLKGDWADARGEKFDIVGSLVLAAALFITVFGFSSLPDVTGMWMIPLGIVIIVVFIRYEKRLKNPIINMKLFTENRAFAFSSLAALIHYSAIFSVSFLNSLFLQYIKGFSPQNAGFVLLAQPVVQTLISPLAGRISDKIQPRIVSSAGMALTTSALIMFTFINENTPVAYFVGGMIIVGLGAGLFASPNANAIMSSVAKRYYGIASAIISTMRQIGIVFSMGIIMMLFTIFMGRVQITPEYYDMFQQSCRVNFMISAVFAFSGMFVSLSRGNIGSTGIEDNDGNS